MTARDLLDANASAAAVYAAFEEEVFKGRARGGGNVFVDAQGCRIAVTDGFFKVRATGKSKLAKDNRGAYARLLARTLRDPAQIWQDEAKTDKRARIRRRYIGRFAVNGVNEDMVAVVEKTAEGLWMGVTAFRVCEQQKRGRYLQRRAQQGRLVFVK